MREIYGGKANIFSWVSQTSTYYIVISYQAKSMSAAILKANCSHTQKYQPKTEIYGINKKCVLESVSFSDNEKMRQ